MMRVLVWLAAAAIMAVAIAAFAPATLVDARVQSLSNGRLRLAEAEGPWWLGRGVIAPADGRWRIPMRWHVPWSSLVRLAPHVSIFPTGDGLTTPFATVERSGNAFRLRDVAIEVSGLALADALPVGPLAAGGELVLATDALQIGDAATGTLRVEWRQARVSAAGELIDLGTITVDLVSRAQGLRGPVGNSGGDVRVSGHLIVDHRQAHLRVRLTPDPATPERARRLLARVGAPLPDGSVSIQLQQPF